MNTGDGMLRPQRRRFYEEALLQEAPRLLSGLDRCPVSASSGCMDREYWAWATKDFANMDLQRGLLVLAYLYCTDFPENIFFKKEALRTWIHAGIRFWIRGQSRSGAFDHLYTAEESWMAAAFTTHDLLVTYTLLEEETPPDLKNVWRAGIERSCTFLCQYDESHGFISNHRAAAAALLLGAGIRFPHPRFVTRAWALMDEVYARQSNEGWFLEYEGCDPGYETLDLHYQSLFHAYAKEKNRIEGPVEHSLNAVRHFMHPDGSLGGEYGSRGCPHFFPAGFEYFADSFPVAEAMARQGVFSLMRGDSCGLADADTRNRIPMATSYVYAHRAASKPAQPGSVKLPWETTGTHTFPDAGIWTYADKNRYVIFGASKGGVVKEFDKEKRCLRFSSCGYAGRCAKGNSITTHLYTRSPRMTVVKDGPPVVTVDTDFYHFRPFRLMTPAKLLLFRMFCLTGGRIRLFSDWVRKHIIIGLFLKARRPAPLRLTRTLKINAQGIQIGDTLVCRDAPPPTELREYGFFATVYMASARYFRQQDLQQTWSSDDLAPLFQEGKLTREHQLGDAPL